MSGINGHSEKKKKKTSTAKMMRIVLAMVTINEIIFFIAWIVDRAAYTELMATAHVRSIAWNNFRNVSVSVLPTFPNRRIKISTIDWKLLNKLASSARTPATPFTAEVMLLANTPNTWYTGIVKTAIALSI
jgi:hypothetical protein